MKNDDLTEYEEIIVKMLVKKGEVYNFKAPVVFDSYVQEDVIFAVSKAEYLGAGKWKAMEKQRIERITKEKEVEG